MSRNAYRSSEYSRRAQPWSFFGNTDLHPQSSGAQRWAGRVCFFCMDRKRYLRGLSRVYSRDQRRKCMGRRGTYSQHLLARHVTRMHHPGRSAEGSRHLPHGTSLGVRCNRRHPTFHGRSACAQRAWRFSRGHHVVWAVS